MNRKEAVEAIRMSGGAIFGVEFIKRSTGEMRVMSCRLGVKSHLRGGEPAYNFAEKGLISVFDMGNKNAYRCVPIEGIVAVTISGCREVVTSD